MFFLAFIKLVSTPWIRSHSHSHKLSGVEFHKGVIEQVASRKTEARAFFDKAASMLFLMSSQTTSFHCPTIFHPSCSLFVI